MSFAPFTHFFLLALVLHRPYGFIPLIRQKYHVRVRHGCTQDHSSESRCQAIPTPLIDVRDHVSFVSQHIVGATSLPLEELVQRSYELPAPFEAALRLCAETPQQLAEARQIVEERGWNVSEAFVFSHATASPPMALTNSQRSGDGQADVGGPLLEAGSTSAQSWRPSAFLADVVDGLLHGHPALSRPSFQVARDKHKQPKRPPRFVVIDLGCGSGRDAVHLAQKFVVFADGGGNGARSNRGGGEGSHESDFAVLGVDNHRGALDRARTLAERSGVSAERCKFVDADLRKLARACLARRRREASSEVGDGTPQARAGRGGGREDSSLAPSSSTYDAKVCSSKSDGLTTTTDGFGSLAEQSFLWPLVREAFFSTDADSRGFVPPPLLPGASEEAPRALPCRVVLVHGCRFLDRSILEALKVDPLFLGWDPVLDPRPSTNPTSSSSSSKQPSALGAAAPPRAPEPGTSSKVATTDTGLEAPRNRGDAAATSASSKARGAAWEAPSVLVWSTFMEGEENLAPPYRPSRRLCPGEMRRIFCESALLPDGEGSPARQTGPSSPVPARPFTILRDETGTLNTRATEVPASFFVALTPAPPFH